METKYGAAKSLFQSKLQSLHTFALLTTTREFHVLLLQEKGIELLQKVGQAVHEPSFEFEATFYFTMLHQGL